ncbi:MAG: Vitamin B12 dependent methionine synthase activation subunit [Clostridia bacterium]|nr:Vitamin B12 dependent methionine synthase activation subunit [Clostridia bacterium]
MSIEVRMIDLPDVSVNEVRRYAGIGGNDNRSDELMEIALAFSKKAKNTVVFGVFDVKCQGYKVDLGFSEVESRGLSRMLSECDKAIVMCATAGLDFDIAAKKYGRTSPALALLIGAVGSERIEALCDEFCREVSLQLDAKGFKLTPRFSPGYGDLPLEFQKEVFSALTPEKYIGVTLGESLMMTPIKSVTAIAGIRKKK